MTACLEELFLLLPIHDVAECEDRLVRRELESREDLDIFALCHHVLAKRFDDHSSIRDRTRSDNLVEIYVMRIVPSGHAGKWVTHDETSVDLPPRPQHQLSRPGGWELFGVFAQSEVDISLTHLGPHEFTIPVGVGIVEELVPGVDDGDLFLLR